MTGSLTQAPRAEVPLKAVARRDLQGNAGVAGKGKLSSLTAMTQTQLKKRTNRAGVVHMG